MRRCQIQSAPSNDRWPNGTRENGKPTFRPDSVPDLTTTIFITSRSAFPDATIIKALFVSELQKLLSDARAQPSDGPAERGRVGLAFASPEHLFADDASGRCLSIRALRLLLTRVYGPDDETLSKQLRRLESLCSTFLELYGDGPANLLRAPACINVLGEHVDYVSYLPTASLPFASREHDMLMLYTPNDSDHVRGASTCKDYPPFNFVLSDGPDSPGDEGYEDEWLSYIYASSVLADWSYYVKGACYYARLKYGDREVRGFDFLVDSTIPPSGGASSSSALVVQT